MTLVEQLIEQGVDLSPEKNNDFVMFNFLLEKALFSKEPNNYLSLVNKISQHSLPFSKDMLALILGKTENLTADDKAFLEMSLAKFLPVAEIDGLLRHIKIKSSSQVRVDREIANAALQEIKQKDESFNQNIRIRFADRQQSFYQFGDLTRSIIKFITGLDVVRENASLNPGTTLVGVVTSTVANYKFGNFSQFLLSSITGKGSAKVEPSANSDDQSPSLKKIK